MGKKPILLVYVEDCIIICKKGSGISNRLIHSLQHGNKHFQLTDEGNLDKCLGVDIKMHKDGKVELFQPHLIDRLLALVDQDKNVKGKIYSVY